MNNAGFAPLAPVREFSLEVFARMAAVNVWRVFVFSQAASRVMAEGGRVITIGSVNADRVPFPGGNAYGMTKAAGAGRTRGLARDLGPVDTKMNPFDGPFALTLVKDLAVGRYGRMEEIGGLLGPARGKLRDWREHDV